jgi:thiamine biosynthesis lipoprotein
MSCGSQEIQIVGETQGTTYSIILPDGSTKLQKSAIDSILLSFDNSLSTYNDLSVLSRFNKSDSVFQIPSSDEYFVPCYNQSLKIAELTNGAFDPSVFSLVKAWGFFEEMSNLPSEESIDSILQFTGFLNQKLYEFNQTKREFTKYDSRFSLDFNAIAQGYSVDVLSEFLEENGVKNYFVEVGGEIRVKGKNKDNESWRIGIDRPIDKAQTEERELTEILQITNCGIATSGNYRKFYTKDGKKYAHTLNPKTGWPAENSLLSATVIAKSAAEADGLATAFMVMGFDQTKKWLIGHSEIKVFLVYRSITDQEKFYRSKGF